MSTIVALATPWGYAALALVRLSGPATAQVVSAICKPMGFGGLSPGAPPRRVWLVDDQGVYDDGLVWIARAPRTYTGEDTAEITLHGNPLLVERLLAAAVGAGARQAMPGAFTRRAVIHGKLDMIAAEGVLQAAQARTMRGVSVARSAMDGRLATHLAGLRSQLVRTTAELEARLDYPGDELALEDDASLVRGLNRTHAELTTLASTFRSGRIVVQGARVALVGAVNAGKSSLFNALLGKKRALVHETPGTTRDVLEASRMIRGVAVTLLDTAGERTTDDPIEAAGLALAQELVADADLVILVLRARPEGLTETERMLLARTAHKPRVVVCNGVDVADPPPLEAILTVATTGQGLEDLERAITKALVGDLPGTAQHVIAAAWQRDALLAAARGVQEAKQALPTAGVAVAADALTQAIEALDALTGADTREDVLDALFSRFCIGK